MKIDGRHQLVDVGPREEDFNSYAAIFYVKREDILAFMAGLDHAIKAEPNCLRPHSQTGEPCQLCEPCRFKKLRHQLGLVRKNKLVPED